MLSLSLGLLHLYLIIFECIIKYLDYYKSCIELYMCIHLVKKAFNYKMQNQDTDWQKQATRSEDDPASS